MKYALLLAALSLGGLIGCEREDVKRHEEITKVAEDGTTVTKEETVLEDGSFEKSVSRDVENENKDHTHTHENRD